MANNGTVTLSFEYNGDGLRTSKTVNGVKHTYRLNGSQIVSEAWGNKLLIYLYDAEGAPVGMMYRNSTYPSDTFDTFWFEKNLQGDIVAVYDEDGTKLISYTYDAWGNFTTTYHNGCTASNHANLNPFRYRGYYYDSELGMYYLQSRYYDPVIGRFINPDKYIFAGQGLIGNNMFAYCGNNPVIRLDTTGEAFETVFDIVTLCFSVIDVICNPTDVGAWIGLVGDVVDLIPFVTGVGEATRALRITDKISDGFGGLTKAKQYGVKAYNALKKTLKGTGLEAHHIIEQRLVKHLNIDVKTMLSVAVTKAEHQKFTNAWRGVFQYGMDYSTLQKADIWKVAQKIYKDYPELLDAAKSILFG